MNIKYHKNFIKNFKKRYGSNPKIKKRYKERLKLFIKNPNDPVLLDHSLKGKKIKTRAFSIAGDIRVTYTKIGSKFLFLDIGTHNQVY